MAHLDAVVSRARQALSLQIPNGASVRVARQVETIADSVAEADCGTESNGS